MEARDRYLPRWFNLIQSRQITLPRFQRFTAWQHSQVADLLTTVLRGLPSGATLILNVGDKEPFPSRNMVDAPATGEKVVEQLLDGQQRLTALWRSLHDKYPDRQYLVRFEEDAIDATSRVPVVYGQARWSKNGSRYPLWVDYPAECWARGYIPICLLRPEDIKGEIDDWIEAAIPNDVSDRHESYKEINHVIDELRQRVREFNLPYLSLPVDTPKEVALDVFIKMNTSMTELSTYDVVVALVEGETGRSLHDHVAELESAVPRAADYADLPGLVLDVVALRQNRSPTQAGYRRIDYTRMLDEWDFVLDGIRGMVGFLEEEAIFDGQRLPTYTAIPIIAALWPHLPIQPDELGNARSLFRKFLWRAFLTSRYEQASTTNALQDYRGLNNVLWKGEPEETVPILNGDSYPLPTEEMALLAHWPVRKTILGRGFSRCRSSAARKILPTEPRRACRPSRPRIAHASITIFFQPLFWKRRRCPTTRSTARSTAR